MATDKSISSLATFAGGCFWCVQHDFDKTPGVLSTTVGYIGGHTLNPTYEQICSGKTGHVEAVQVVFDPAQIDFAQLLDVYWHGIDPTRCDGQFCDVGAQYRPIIFYHDPLQKQIAEDSKQALIAMHKTILVDILPATTFYPAESYHQQYYKKEPLRYQSYKSNSGRDQRLKKIWGP